MVRGDLRKFGLPVADIVQKTLLDGFDAGTEMAVIGRLRRFLFLGDHELLPFSCCNSAWIRSAPRRIEPLQYKLLTSKSNVYIEPSFGLGKHRLSLVYEIFNEKCVLAVAIRLTDLTEPL